MVRTPLKRNVKRLKLNPASYALSVNKESVAIVTW